jgi:hypothetical protein
MKRHRGASPPVIAATAYYLTAMDSRSDPLVRQHLLALAAFDDSRMHDAHAYCDRRVDRSRDPSHDLRALDVIDDALLHLRKR